MYISNGLVSGFNFFCIKIYKQWCLRMWLKCVSQYLKYGLDRQHTRFWNKACLSFSQWPNSSCCEHTPYHTLRVHVERVWSLLELTSNPVQPDLGKKEEQNRERETTPFYPANKASWILTKRDRERERQAQQQTHTLLCYEWQMWSDWLRQKSKVEQSSK